MPQTAGLGPMLHWPRGHLKGGLEPMLHWPRGHLTAVGQVEVEVEVGEEASLPLRPVLVPPSSHSSSCPPRRCP